MSNIDRYRGLLKLGGREQVVQDLQHVFSSVAHAASLGHDAEVEQLWLSTREPTRIDFSDEPDDFMVAQVLDESSAPAIAEMEIDEMLGDTPTNDQAHMRDTLGLAPGVELGDREKGMLRGIIAETLRKMGGVAIVSSQTPEGLAAARGFYEDTRNLGR